MRPAAIVAFGAVSSLGRGVDALGILPVGVRALTRVERDALLVAAGIKRPSCARVAVPWSPRRADALLTDALDQCVASLDQRRPGWHALRVGLALGTSSGAMDGAERAYEAIARGEVVADADAYDLAYAAPFVRARAHLGLSLSREAHVLGACASSTLALGLAAAWLDADACDVVLAGGYDVVTAFVASGFTALGAVTATVPRPFRLGRDGLALGEGAAVVALVREDVAALGHLSGFAAASDAQHLTAPDRDAKALTRACRRALASAGLTPGDVGLIGAHGTATVYNDASESRAFHQLFGDAAPVVHALKGQLGHTLGAAGALEVLSLAVALHDGVAPASAGDGPVDPDAAQRVLDVSEPSTARHALKTSLAFGGLDAVLLVSVDATVTPPHGCVATKVSLPLSVGLADATVELLAERVGLGADRVARWDTLTRLVVAAAATAAADEGFLRDDDVAIVVGHDVATVATNAEYAHRLAVGRPAEPRRFPYTSPNACAGEASSALGLRGPAFAVGGAPGLAAQALDVARDLVAHGLASAAIAIEVTESSVAGALLWAAWGEATPSPFARAVVVTTDRQRRAKSA